MSWPLTSVPGVQPSELSALPPLTVKLVDAPVVNDCRNRCPSCATARMPFVAVAGSELMAAASSPAVACVMSPNCEESSVTVKLPAGPAIASVSPLTRLKGSSPLVPSEAAPPPSVPWVSGCGLTRELKSKP